MTLTSQCKSMNHGGTEMEPDLVEVKDEVMCSVCGQNLLDLVACHHWPGETYRVEGKDVLCHPLIYQQRLYELRA